MVEPFKLVCAIVDVFTHLEAIFIVVVRVNPLPVVEGVPSVAVRRVLVLVLINPVDEAGLSHGAIVIADAPSAVLNEFDCFICAVVLLNAMLLALGLLDHGLMGLNDGIEFFTGNVVVLYAIPGVVDEAYILFQSIVIHIVIV